MKARADVRLADDVGPTLSGKDVGADLKVGPYRNRMEMDGRCRYSATMVSCGTTLMNGEKLAVRPNRSVAVTV